MNYLGKTLINGLNLYVTGISFFYVYFVCYNIILINSIANENISNKSVANRVAERIGISEIDVAEVIIFFFSKNKNPFLNLI